MPFCPNSHLRLPFAKLILFISLLCVSVVAQTENITLTDFAQLPDIGLMKFSPNGEAVASTIRIDTKEQKGTAIQVANLKTGEKKIVLFSDNDKYFIHTIHWKGEKYIIVKYYYPFQRSEWLGTLTARFESREFRMLIVDLEAGEVRRPFKKSFLKKYKVLPSNLANVIDYLPNDKDHVLVSLPTNYAFNTKFSYGVFRLNLKNQKIKQVKKSEDNIYSWMTDQQHKVRLGMYYHHSENMQRVHVKRPADGKWLELWEHEMFSEDNIRPLGFGKDPKDLYIRAYHNGFKAIFKVDLNSEDLKRELVYENPGSDVYGHLVYSPLTKEVVGVSQAEGHGGYTYFDDDLARLQRSLNKLLPDTKNRIISMSDNLTKYLLFSSSDVDSGTFWIGDRNAKSLDVIGYRYKSLTPNLMAKKELLKYKARDGLEVEGYLTIPVGGKKEGLPLLVFPHGGPISADDDSFDYFTQFFAHKGYAVIQPNFRGSSGKGFEFLKAGLGNWGLEMQDDVEDAVHHLVKKGIVDGDRVCIVGASYGGYAALMGAAKTPDLYKCAISINGVSNVYELVKKNRQFWRSYNYIDEQIGNSNSHLKSISPVNHASKIKAPVLLVHGELDRQVNIDHSYQMRDELVKADKVVEFLELPNEDHYLTDGNNRIKTFQAMDAFLDKYLPVSP